MNLLGHDDMSPGEAMLNGSIASNNHHLTGTKHMMTQRSQSSQSLASNSLKPTRPAPNMHASASGQWSAAKPSPLTSQQSTLSNASASSLSTTQYLLSAKRNATNANAASHNNGTFSSNSNPNLSDWDAVSFDVPSTTGTSGNAFAAFPSSKNTTSTVAPSNNIDLLGSLEDDFGVSTNTSTTAHSSSYPSTSNFPVFMLNFFFASFLHELPLSFCLFTNLNLNI